MYMLVLAQVWFERLNLHSVCLLQDMGAQRPYPAWTPCQHALGMQITSIMHAFPQCHTKHGTNTNEPIK